MNIFDVEEAALISMSQMLRSAYDLPTYHMLALIEAGISLEDADHIVNGEDPDLAMWREELRRPA